MICLDIGCGNRKRGNYIGIDKCLLDGVNIGCNVEKGMPIKDNTVDRVYSKGTVGLLSAQLI